MERDQILSSGHSSSCRALELCPDLPLVQNTAVLGAVLSFYIMVSLTQRVDGSELVTVN